MIYMGMKHLAEIAARLLAAGRAESDPVAVVTEASHSGQRVVETTLARCVADTQGLEPPAIICIGGVVTLRQMLDWQAMAQGAPPRTLDPFRRGHPAAAS